MSENNINNVLPVSYRKCLPEFEGATEESLNYIDLHYTPKFPKLPHSSSESKFNSLPNIKSGRRAKYLSSLEGIIFPKSDTKDNLTMETKDMDADTESKTSESTTVVVSTSDSVCSDSPRGVSNEGFIDDDEVDHPSKKEHRRSPSSSTGKDEKNLDVSYSSSESTVDIPEVMSEGALKKKAMAEEYEQYCVPNSQLKRGFRGQKLHFKQNGNQTDGHLRRFCWWMICLVLLAGAITVTALIGVGVIKLPLQTETKGVTDHETTETNGPRAGPVRSVDAPYVPTGRTLIDVLSTPKQTEDEIEDTGDTNVKESNDPRDGAVISTQTTTMIPHNQQKIAPPVKTTIEQILRTMRKTTTSTPRQEKVKTTEQASSTSSAHDLSSTMEVKLITTTEQMELKTPAEEDKETTEHNIQDPVEDEFKQTADVLDVQKTTTIGPVVEVSTETEFIEPEEGSTVEVDIEIVEGSGSLIILNEELGSGEEMVVDDAFKEEVINEVETSDKDSKTISVKDLLIPEEDRSSISNAKDLEINNDYSITRPSPELKEEADEEVELVVTLPEMLSGSFLNILNKEENNSFNGEDAFNALLDLILPKSEGNEDSELSIEERINKHIGSQ